MLVLAAQFNLFRWSEIFILSLQMYLRDFCYYLNNSHLLLFSMQKTHVYLEAGNEWYPSLYDEIRDSEFNEIRDSEVKPPTTLRHPNPGIMQFCCNHSCVHVACIFFVDKGTEVVCFIYWVLQIFLTGF